jgi:hypothetical protein
MDFHDDLKLPPEAIEQIAQESREGVADQFGVHQAELYHNGDGKVYCLLDAPDEEAVRQHPRRSESLVATCTAWTASANRAWFLLRQNSVAGGPSVMPSTTTPIVSTRPILVNPRWLVQGDSFATGAAVRSEIS